MKSSIPAFTLLVLLLPAVVAVQGPEASAPPASDAPSSGQQPQTAVKPAEKNKEGRRMPLKGFELQPPSGASGTRVTISASRGGGDAPVVVLAPARGRLLGRSALFAR